MIASNPNSGVAATKSGNSCLTGTRVARLRRKYRESRRFNGCREKKWSALLVTSMAAAAPTLNFGEIIPTALKSKAGVELGRN